MSDSNNNADKFVLMKADKVVLIYKLLLLSSVGVGSIELPHRLALRPTIPKRPDLLIMGTIGDAATVSKSDGILRIDDANG